MRCTIWYHLYNFKNVKACNFTKSNTPPWVFFMFLKLYRLYQMVEIITYVYQTLVLIIA